MKMERHTHGFKGNTTFYGKCRLERKMANKMKFISSASQIKKKKGRKRKEILIFLRVPIFTNFEGKCRFNIFFKYCFFGLR